jgi:ABC-type Fe3+ transport system permease subunit
MDRRLARDIVVAVIGSLIVLPVGAFTLHLSAFWLLAVVVVICAPLLFVLSWLADTPQQPSWTPGTRPPGRSPLGAALSQGMKALVAMAVVVMLAVITITVRSIADSSNVPSPSPTAPAVRGSTSTGGGAGNTGNTGNTSAFATVCSTPSGDCPLEFTDEQVGTACYCTTADGGSGAWGTAQ